MYDLKIPKRTMFFMGPQRCGKTTALHEMVRMSNAMKQHILLVGASQQLNEFMTFYGRTEKMVNAHAQVHLLTHHSDEPFRTNLSEFDLVAYVGSTIFVKPGHVKLYEKPGGCVINLFERLSESTAYTPRIYFESHFNGTENDVAVG